MSIVPLTGPHHRSMGPKCDGLIVKVLRLVDDADAFHDAIPSAEREWNTRCLVVARFQNMIPRQRSIAAGRRDGDRHRPLQKYSRYAAMPTINGPDIEITFNAASTEIRSTAARSS
jgi:hypothetical protein